MVLRARGAFTLVEMMVVGAIVSLLIWIVLPALSASRAAARQVACLSNMRSLETANWLYMLDHDGVMLGTSHEHSWVDALRSYDGSLLLRSPADRSPHFEGGTPVGGVYRVTSYSINVLLSPDHRVGVGRIDAVPFPVATAHFVIAAFEGSAAVADHVHPTLWWSPIPDSAPGNAAVEMQTNAHGGDPGGWNARSTYGFLDGHAEVRTFESVFTDLSRNQFDPRVAR